MLPPGASRATKPRPVLPWCLPGRLFASPRQPSSLGRMLTLVLLLVTTQVPPVPGEPPLVSFCKQGRVSACEELKRLFPEKYAEVAAELAKAALRYETLRAADEAGRDDADAKDGEAAGVEAAGEVSGEPPNCDGQNHHVISRPIAKELERHETLGGLYEAAGTG